jgi:hypothetical protein
MVQYKLIICILIIVLKGLLAALLHRQNYDGVKTANKKGKAKNAKPTAYNKDFFSFFLKVSGADKKKQSP